MALINPNMILSEVVERNPSLIPVINRFNIHLGLSDWSIEQLCQQKGIDVNFFLVIINTFLNKGYFPEKELRSFHTDKIVEYLKLTNEYYLQQQIPNIERHLMSFIKTSSNENQILTMIGRFFATFKEEFIQRIERDEKVWFPYCLSLSKQLNDKAQEVPLFLNNTEEEDNIEALLHDLKSILIKHLVGKFNENLCYATIFSIHSLEIDIKQHNHIRYHILMPMLKAMEGLLTDNEKE